VYKDESWSLGNSVTGGFAVPHEARLFFVGAALRLPFNATMLAGQPQGLTVRPHHERLNFKLSRLEWIALFL